MLTHQHQSTMTIMKTKTTSVFNLAIALAAIVCAFCVTPKLIVAQVGKKAVPQEKSENPKDTAPAESQLPDISNYYPAPKLKVATTRLKHAKFPVIDIHSHFGFRLKGDKEALKKYVEVMDRNRIALTTTLDARLGSEEEHIKFLKDHRERFIIFAHIDFVGDGSRSKPKTWVCNQPGFVRTTCEQLKRAKSSGISGIKFFKQFGLGYKNADGSLIKIDDPRFDPIWEACGNLDLPIIIHTGDPAAFFDPIDPKNERYEELSRHPNWSFHGDQFPSRSELLAARNRVIAKHRGTKFIGAHLAGNSEDLATVAQWLDAHPNLVVEISSRIGELGRQPFTARKFVMKYQDRILFGTDGPFPEQRLRCYWRFLETEDEYFPYSEKEPQPQGLWFIYGLNLPDEVLKKIYYANALDLIPAVATQYTSNVKK